MSRDDTLVAAGLPARRSGVERPRCGRRLVVVVMISAGLAVVVAAGCTPGSTPRSTRSAGVRAGGGARSAGTAVAERLLPPSRWRISRLGSQHAVEGWADRTSAAPGDRVRLYVSTPASSFVVRAYRMGWYRGGLGRLVWTSAQLPGRVQASGRVVAATRTVQTSWRPSLTMSTRGWLPGDYLLRLDASNGASRYVPLTLRAGSAAGRVVIVNAVTTWQAYNDWGGYTLYQGPGGKSDFTHRSRAVSFDRPYAGDGAGQFRQRELPVLALAEHLGLPLDYVTDVDLDRNPKILTGARAVLSLGHDEYWSPAMRAAVTRARDAGTNVAFLGANAVFRRIRYAPTRTGPDRLEINYKRAGEDPLNGVDDPAVTADWPYPPAPDPESTLTGLMYDCFPARGDMIVTDPSAWIFAGTRVHAGQHLPGVVAPESDRVNLSWPTPRPIEVFTHSPLTCKGHPTYSDSAYYTTRSGAGVYAAGTIDLVCALRGSCTAARNRTGQRVLTRMTSNLLRAFAAGPAGRTHPAHDNLAALHVGRATGPY